jgi:predicted 3-demethylubiquinone-9 3-methyltransferase (glyoxalase superfamily)
MPLNKITTFLWFDTQAEEAANFYTSIFKESRIKHVSRYTESGKQFHGKEPGSAMTVAFELDGHPFVALNGGSQYKFSEAISFQIDCKDQEEVDYFWDKLGEEANPEKQRCGK